LLGMSPLLFSLWSFVMPPGAQEEGDEAGDNLSHGDAVRTLRALCFLAQHEKAHEDITTNVFPSLSLLLPQLLGSLTRAWDKLHAPKDTKRKKRGAGWVFVVRWRLMDGDGGL
jgi:hypothetical protein